VETVS